MSDSPAATRPAQNPTRQFSLLLIEPYFVLRRTVASVAGSLNGITVVDVPTLESAGPLMSFQRFDGLVMALDGQARQGVLDLLNEIREGRTPCDKDVCVAVTADACDMNTIASLKQLNVRRILLKPFKVKTILETVSAFAAQEAGPPR